MQVTMEILVAALILVESGGDPRAINASEDAVGILQIRPIMVEDVNRIVGYEAFTLEDRFSPSKSLNMCLIYLTNYCEYLTTEQQARCWNGGPRGHEKESTMKYWEKVHDAIQVILAEEAEAEAVAVETLDAFVEEEE